MSQGALAVALRFVAETNAKNIDGITALMASDHRFVDSGGDAHDGVDVMREGWRQYFRMVPDYLIEIDEPYSEGPIVVMLGAARGTCSRMTRRRSMMPGRRPLLGEQKP
jgi:hypothetical protein